MSALDRIRGLAAKAQETIDSMGSRQSNYYKALLRAYNQCAAICKEEEADKQTDTPPASGELADAAVEFCTGHCFHGRKHGPGEADECSICPLAPHALAGVELQEADDSEEIERLRQERARREARKARARLAERGTDTFAAYNDPAPRARTVRAAEPGEGD